MKTILNYTPHEVKVFLPDGTTRVFPSVGVARVKQVNLPKGDIDGIPLACADYGEIEGLPEAEDDIFFIVSSLVAAAAGDYRFDLLVPTDFVRDENGNITGCRRFLA